MFNQIDLRKLAEMSSPDRAFLSIYLSEPDSLAKLEQKLTTVGNILKSNKDEYEQFRENANMVMDYLEKDPFESGSLVIFSCWLLNYLQAYPIEVKVKDLIRVDSSPYIKPIAELQDEYENFAVVVADNNRARIFLVASSVVQDEEQVKGNVKNHVKVGGWSQQRYERRRDKELHLYAKEIIETLAEFDKEKEFNKIILVGGQEIIQAIENALPSHLKEQLVGDRVIDLNRGDNYVNQEIFELFFEEEDKEGVRLWQTIKNQYMRGELGVVGINDVLKAAREGRIERGIVNRNAEIKGFRCRECEGLFIRKTDVCPKCGSSDIFEVDMVNEIVELLLETSADMEFVDGIEELKEAGDIAALLRY
ncbi:hypothetical protein JXI42_11255 [bacterium]|nr:hypothetical protein [bacterium]